MKSTFVSLAIALAVATGASGARAESKLSTEVITASEPGFLVDATLISGDKDAVLIDSSFTLADAHRLAAAILDSKKNLTTVYITHWHPDHYFGLTVLKQAFPKAKFVALPATVAEIKKTWKAKVKQWQPLYGDAIPAQPVLPTAMTGKTLTLEGQTLEIHGGVQGDSANNSYVWIPSIKTVVTGDIVYHGVFPWTAETDAAGRTAWLKTLDELTALGATTVVPGHKTTKMKDDASGIEQTRAYLKAFDETAAASKTADELETKMKAKYGDLQLPIILHIAAGAQFPAAPPAPAAKK
ncbi:MAG TPA: MBL fold metallo-hydrolase [Polyangia bacterium]|jgi:glyoxylase-like metal-dependent hydrolase (beta-lactamase superfamily II)